MSDDYDFLDFEYGVDEDAIPAVIAFDQLARTPEVEHRFAIAKQITDDPHFFDSFADPEITGAVVTMMLDTLQPGRPDPGSGPAPTAAGYRLAVKSLTNRVKIPNPSSLQSIAMMAAINDRDPEAAEELAKTIVASNPNALASQQVLGTFALFRNEFATARAYFLKAGPDVFEDTLAVLDEFPDSNAPTHLSEQQRNFALWTKFKEFLVISKYNLDYNDLCDKQIDRLHLPEFDAPTMMNIDVLTDLILVEGGLVEELMETAARILPADDVKSGKDLLERGRTVLRVDSVTPGEGFHATDLRTDKSVEIRSAAVPKKGDLLCTRVLPEDGAFGMYGGVERIRPKDGEPLVELLNGEPTASGVAHLVIRKADR
ncbi:hypothetical protein [Gordonia sp. (in: high G+C Gram-positive bacteria)]|uniref:hypothetical protein n=1 Tax=Gordonia sp. (in: high G+C Gram-positive bacteria) TaxID=84139 RepID=UPI003C739439